MKLNKALYYSLIMGVVGLGFFSSCKDDEVEEVEDVIVKARYSLTSEVEELLDPSIVEGRIVEFIFTYEEDTFEYKLDADGKIQFELESGNYHIKLNDTIVRAADEDSIFLKSELLNVYIHSDTINIEAPLKVTAAKANADNFLIKEIRTNSSNGAGTFISIVNPTSETLYADGLSVALTKQASSDSKAAWYDDFMDERTPIRSMITIPGAGTTYAVKPSQEIIIAMNATGETANADFEVFRGEGDTDNANVPNVIVAKIDGEEPFNFDSKAEHSPLLVQISKKGATEQTVKEFLHGNTAY